MSLSRYLLGIVLLSIFAASILISTRSLRIRLLPDWSGAPAILAEIVFGLTATIGLLEVLGALRLFHVAAVLVAAVTLAAGTTSWNRRTARPEPPLARRSGVDTLATQAQKTDPFSLVACVIVVAVLCAAWGTHTIASLRDGMSTSIDSNWYHLPAAARFAQTGVATNVHFFDGASLTAFYPASTPLLHALGIELLGSDLLSPVLNCAFLGLTLLAAWCLGRAFGVAPVALVAVASVLATPMLATTQPGGAYNDIVGIALVLSAIALLACARPWTSRSGIAAVRVAAVAAGLALGTKYGFILPVAALSLGVILLAQREQRLQRARDWTVLVVLAGGYFYVRNFVVVGNPVPPVSVHLGPWSLPKPPSGVDEIAPLSVLDQRGLWRSIFMPALRNAFGPLWWLLLLLISAGIVFALATRGDSFVRMLGMVAAVSAAGYLVTPASIGTRQLPIQFVYSLRYAACAAVLAAVSLVISFIGRRYPRLVLSAFASLLVAAQLDPSIWPTDLRDSRFSEPVRGANSIAAALLGLAVLLAGTAVVVVRRRTSAWRPPVVATLVIGLAVVVTGAFIHDVYLRNRYADSEYLAATYRWARAEQGERIGIVGTPLQYPLYGNDLSNHVQYVGRRGSRGSFFPITTCRAWRNALTTGRYDYVVTAQNPLILSSPIEALWTESDPAATVRLRDGYATVFRLAGPLDPAGCDDLGSRASVQTAREQPPRAIDAGLRSTGPRASR